MAARILRQQNCIWRPQVTMCSSVASSKSPAQGEQEAQSTDRVVLDDFVSAVVVSYQAFVSSYPTQQKEMCHTK